MDLPFVQFIFTSPLAGANDARRVEITSGLLATLGDRLAPYRRHQPSAVDGLVRGRSAATPLAGPLELEIELHAYPADEFRGGQITKAAVFWNTVLLPESGLPDGLKRRISGWVTAGVDIRDFFKPFADDFMGKSYRSPKPLPYHADNHVIREPALHAFVTEELGRLLAVGAIAREATPPLVVLPLGVEPKKPRLILDARYLNLWCPSEDMQYETLRHFQQGIAVDDWLFSLDHKSGYHHVPLVEACWQYMGFQWEGQYYTFRVLPFGWAPACFVYNSMSAVLASFIRARGLHCIYYLDDFGFSIPACVPLELRYQCVAGVLDVMYLAGFTVSIPKSALHPLHRLLLLGFGIDSHKQRFYVPAKKLEAILALVQEIGSALVVSRLTLQSFIGKMYSLSLAVPPVAIFMQSLNKAISEADKSGSNAIHLSDAARIDVRALNALQGWERISTWPSERHLRMRMDTDASGRGWGGVLYTDAGPVTASGHFARAEMPFPIHIKEMLGVKLTLEALGDRVRRCFLDLYTDNTTVEHTLLNGDSIVPELRAFSRDLLEFQLRNQVIVKVHRIATKDNVLADGLSRLPCPESGRARVAAPPPPPLEQFERSDHMLGKRWFAKLQREFPRFTIDACANGRNTQCARYISRHPSDDVRCMGSNVFSFSFPLVKGRPEFVYCNPPWALIPGLWRHFADCRARGVMLVPRLPHRPWFGTLSRDSVSSLTLARMGDLDVFRQPSRAYLSSVGPVPWDLLAFEFDFSG